MKKTEAIVLLFSIVSIAALGSYCLHLSGRLDDSEVLIGDLIAQLNTSKQQLADASHSIEILNERFRSESESGSAYAYLAYKKTVSELLDSKIGEVIDKEAYGGGKWFVAKVNFIGPSFVSVEYEDGHDAHIALVQITKTDEGFSFETVN